MKKHTIRYLILLLSILVIISICWVIFSPMTPPRYQNPAFLTRLYNISRKNPDTSFVYLLERKRGIAKGDHNSKPSMSKDLVVYNPDNKKDEKDWIAFIETTPLKLFQYRTCVLWNDGSVSTNKNRKELIEGKINLQYYYFEKGADLTN